MTFTKNNVGALLLTLLIAVFFIFLNPFYALALASVINLFFKRINPIIFAFLLSLSFALLFSSRDPATGGDVMFYILRYSGNQGIIYSLSLAFVEPLWSVYELIMGIILTKNQDLYVLSSYFLLFLLLTILARKISRDKYIIVLFCLVLFNLGILYGIFQLWRNSFAFLLFFIGIYSSRAKILIYLSAFVQVITIPFIIISSKINLKVIIAIAIILLIMSSYIFEKIDIFEGSVDQTQFNIYFMLLSILLLILRSLKLIKLNRVENNFLYALILFTLFPLLVETSGALSMLYSRMGLVFMFFGSIMISKFVISNGLISGLFIIVYSIYRFLISFNNPDILYNLASIGDNRPLYAYNGILLLIKNYDSSRWSDFISNNDCIVGILLIC